MSPNVQEQPAPEAITTKSSPSPSSPGRQLFHPRPSNRGAERIWRVKLLRCLKRQRNRVEPNLHHPHLDQKVLNQQPGCEFFTVSPRRVLRVLRPELKSGRFYEPPRGSSTNNPGGISGRRESIEDNFYARWARRPHPSGNCRCSFRRSTASSSASQVSLEELAVSQQINRIRASLCEAERSGRSAEAEIEHIERTLGLPLTGLANLQVQNQGSGSVVQVPSAREVSSRLEPLDERTRERIVEGLERYISNLLDEILDETIKALAKADRPFDSGRPLNTTTTTPTSFDISFSFHGKEGEGEKRSEDDKGYVNQGFVGSLGDPDALDFQLRRDVVVAEELAVDCVDSGINSVETIELQPEVSETMEQQQDLEQSLMEIIDAKLGGTSIGKSLENLGLEIDAEDRAANEGKSQDPDTVEAQHTTDSKLTSRKDDNKESPPTSKAEVQQHQAPKSSSPNSSLGHLPQAPRPASERTSRSLDEVTEEPRFNSLRLQFKRRNNASNSSNTSKPSPTKSSSQQQQPRVLTARKLVSCRLNKTMRMIRRRLAARLACTPTRRKPTSSSSTSPSKAQQQYQQQQQQQSSLELEDYRRRFPVPELKQGQKVRVEEDWEGSVRLRNRKPTLVFLHGFGSSADAFGSQLNYFAELGYPCIAPDLLGHGMSSAPNRASEYKFCKLLADLEAILSHYAFKPGHKCVIVAHNYGCSFATVLADKYSGSVHQLVLISGGGPTPLAPPPKEGPGHCCLRASLAPLLVCGMQRAVLYSARGRQHPYCGDPELLLESPGDAVEDVEEGEEGLREKRLEEAALRQRPSHMRHVLAGMSWPEGDYVFHRRIATPTLLVHGLRDNKVSLVQECQMERTMVKAFLEAIPAAGHVPMTDCPDQLNHMIHCFIDLWKNKKW